MHTIRLRINDKIFNNLIWFLGKFNKEELQIIEENNQFSSVQDYLKKELVKLDNGKEDLIDIDEVDRELERTINKYEN